MTESQGPEDQEGPPLIRMILGEGSPSDLLSEQVTRLDATPEPDPDLCLEVGCGDLESLLGRHESELWPEVERLARENPRFRRALSSVWAYDSPMFSRREALLAELGEATEITLRFTVQPEDFSPDPQLSWRALETDARLSPNRLAEVLRSIANSVENSPPEA